MNSAKLNDWLQVIGLFGVFASLIFVGLQMMQDREIALSAIYQERSAVAAELYFAAASNPQVANDSHYQWEQGFAPDAHWQQIRATLKSTLRHPFSRNTFMSTPMRPSFERALQDIVAEIEVESPAR